MTSAQGKEQDGLAGVAWARTLSGLVSHVGAIALFVARHLTVDHCSAVLHSRIMTKPTQCLESDLLTTQENEREGCLHT